MVLVDGTGTPLGAYLDAASPAEVTLLAQTLASQPIRGKPERLIADRGYDSNAVRRFLKRRRIQPIIPARSNNRRATHQAQVDMTVPSCDAPLTVIPPSGRVGTGVEVAKDSAP